jgi:hypothetical protein
MQAIAIALRVDESADNCLKQRCHRRLVCSNAFPQFTWGIR